MSESQAASPSQAAPRRQGPVFESRFGQVLFFYLSLLIPSLLVLRTVGSLFYIGTQGSHMQYIQALYQPPRKRFQLSECVYRWLQFTAGFFNL